MGQGRSVRILSPSQNESTAGDHGSSSSGGPSATPGLDRRRAGLDSLLSNGPTDVPIAAIVACLEAIWTDLRGGFPALPAVAIVVAPGGRAKWGHFAPCRWVRGVDPSGVPTGRPIEFPHEILIAGERLTAPEDVLETLLHEAAHALVYARGFQSVSRQGRYHTKSTFKPAAEELGLVVEPHPTHGWALTSLSEAALTAFEYRLRQLDSTLDAFRRPLAIWQTSMGGKPGSTRQLRAPRVPSVLLQCGCTPPRFARVKGPVADQGGIHCDFCRLPLTPTSRS